MRKATKISMNRPSQSVRPTTLDDMTGEGKARLIADVPKRFHVEVKRYAIDSGQTVTEVLTSALRQYMDSHPAD